jgi:ornithine cyclodeaminase/alanine dehydrogenase-like protein (mu-crystallin family)
VSGSQLRYLSAADVEAAMPDIEQRLQLARRTMDALDGGSQLPPKIGVHPRPVSSFGHAMPAWLDGGTDDGAGDLLGIKWVVGFPTNSRLGLPAIHGTVLLSDASTGAPRAVLDAGPVTAHRTAAVSGICLERWAPKDKGRPLRIAMAGAGVQARSHLPVLARLLPGSDLVVTALSPDRAQAIVSAAEQGGAFGSVTIAADAASAIEGSDVALTLVSFGPQRQIVPAAAFASCALVVAVDYDMCVPAQLARDAHRFVVDDRGQFLATRASGVFAGYPDPDATIGVALGQPSEPAGGLVLVSHLGVGLADVVFGDAIVRAAEARGIGTVLNA